MKEHDSRRCMVGEDYSFYVFTDYSYTSTCFDNDDVYVDSNNLLHNLNGYAWSTIGVDEYWIHGKEFKSKNDWEIEVNRILMLDELC